MVEVLGDWVLNSIREKRCYLFGDTESVFHTDVAAITGEGCRRPGTV